MCMCVFIVKWNRKLNRKKNKMREICRDGIFFVIFNYKELVLMPVTAQIDRVTARHKTEKLEFSNYKEWHCN